MKKYKLLTQEGYPTLIKGNTYSSEYNDFEDVNISVKELVVLHPKDWELVEEDFVLPEKWYVKTDSTEKEKLVREYFNKTFKADINSYASDENWYFSYPAYNHLYVVKSSPNDIEYLEITFEQFKKYVLNIREEKEIIGYKFKDSCKEYLRAAKEIVTTCECNFNKVFNYDVKAVLLWKKAGVLDLWFEPIYKTIPQIIINGHKGEFFENYVKFGCAKIGSNTFLSLNDAMKFMIQTAESNKEIESVTIGKGTFTKEQIKEIAEYYLNKN